MNFIYIIVVVAVVVVAYVVSQRQARKAMGLTRDFLEKHPDAVKIYLIGKFGLVSESVFVATVDGEAPPYFSEGLGIPGLPGTKSGIYALPGTRTLELTYTRNRPGVLYKNVTTSTDLVKKQFVVEAGRPCLLGFDRKTEEFTFRKE